MAPATAPLFDFLGWRPIPERRGPLPTLVPPPPPVEPGTREEVRQLRAGLEARIAARLSSGTELLHALAKQRREDVTPTTLGPLDVLLGGGLPRGKMVELAGRSASGRFSIAMATLAGTTSAGEAAALIDLGDHFDPQFGVAAGIDLRRMLWIRPETLKQSVAAAEMIGAAGFQLVIIDAGLPPVRGRRVPDASWVRLARVAEGHGTTLLVSTPYAVTGTASEIVLGAFGGRARWLGRGKSPRVLAGFETRVRIEKQRRMPTGHSATMFFRMMEAVATEEPT